MLTWQNGGAYDSIETGGVIRREGGVPEKREDYMKKAIFLALIAVAVSGAFAQTPGLTFGTWSYAEGTLNTSPLFEIYNEVYIAYKARDMGLNSTIVGTTSWTSGALTGPTLDFQDFAIWYKPFPFLKATAGKLLETGDATLSSYIDGNKFSRQMAKMEPGIMATVYPTRELTFSAFTPFTESGILATIAKSSFSLKYAIPKFANLVASYRLREYEFAAGIDFRMISDLTLKIGFKHFTAPSVQSGLLFTAGKRFGDLNLGLDSDLVILPGIAVGVKGMVEYTIGKYILGTTVALDTNDFWYANNGTVIAAYIRQDFSAGSVRAMVSYNTATRDWRLPLRFVIFF